MKKTLLAVAMTAALALGITACGGKEESKPAPTPAPTTAAVETTQAAPETEAQTEAVEEAAEEEIFTLMDVSTEMIESGIYAVDENNNENVIALFTAPNQESFIAMISINADGTGDAVCGSYNADSCATLTGEDGTEWACVIFTDVYSGAECTAVFADFDDGSVMISNEDLSYAVAGEYLTPDQTIDYLGAAVALLDQAQ